MPRIGYEAGSDRSEWYTIERLLRKYASIYGITAYVYVSLLSILGAYMGSEKTDFLRTFQVLLPKVMMRGWTVTSCSILGMCVFCLWSWITYLIFQECCQVTPTGLLLAFFNVPRRQQQLKDFVFHKACIIKSFGLFVEELRVHVISIVIYTFKLHCWFLQFDFFEFAEWRLS